MGVLSIANKKRNIKNITLNSQGWKTGILVEIVETNYLDWSWVVATQVTDIPFGLAFRENLKKRALYWRHGINPLPE